LRIIGVDPAPSKPTRIYSTDGLDRKDARQLLCFLTELLSSDDDVLICWDAPLTGPSNPDSDVFNVGDHTQRRIESFFNQKKLGLKVPKGISVRGYAGCPHWAISRRLIGLPRVGRWDAGWSDLPFQLVANGSCPTRSGHYIVEVHPGVALWLWCNTPAWVGSWEYKKDKNILRQVWRELRKRFENTLLQSGTTFRDLEFAPEDDDELDCFVAWLLGTLWCQGNGEVVLLGDRETGSMLLPRVESLVECFHRFTNETASGIG
jgi:predicted RNase H-like nuclease